MKKGLHLITLLGTTLLSQSIQAQTISFAEAAESTGTFQTFTSGSCQTVDIDNDGDMDIFVLGSNGYQSTAAAMYMNDGSGNFTEQILSNVLGLTYSSCDFADVNGDGFLDLVTTGRNGTSGTSGKATIVYKYENGNFVAIHNFSGVEGGASKFIDYDNNGKPDMVYTGTDGYQNVLNVYKNNNGVLSIVNYPGINKKYREGAEIAVGDLNNDGYLDMIICGTNHSSSNTRSTDVYLNSHNGTFGEYSLGNLPAYYEAGIALGDVDGNGTLDAFITGSGNTAKLYLNDGTGSFTASTVSFTSANYAKAQMADLDNDGDLDIIYNGSSSFYMYQNDGTGNFTEVTHTLPGANRGNLAIADFDGDGLLDIYQCGTSSLRYLKNTSCTLTTTNLNNIVSFCEVNALYTETITAEDCEGSEYTATTTQTLPISTIGTTHVLWTFTDENNNTFTKIQNVTIEAMNTTVTVQDAVLTAELAGASYQWIDCQNGQNIPGATSQSFTAPSNGAYKVQITLNGCTETSGCTQVTSLGLQEVTSVNASIFPNPSTEGVFAIRSESIINSYQLMDINGKEFSNGQPVASEFIVDLSNVPSGMYFITLATENGIQTFKLMK